MIQNEESTTPWRFLESIGGIRVDVSKSGESAEIDVCKGVGVCCSRAPGYGLSLCTHCQVLSRKL